MQKSPTTEPTIAYRTADNEAAGGAMTAPHRCAYAGVLPQSAAFTRAILIVLALLAIVSSYVAVREALSSGIDYQWSGAHLLSLHQDPWKTYILGDPNKQIILGQQPNYLHEFYVILLPLGSMPFETARAFWCVINLVLLAGILVMISRLFQLDRNHSILLALLVLSSTPFRVTMSNGQNGIFILFMFTLLFYFRNRAVKGLALGLSYSKYSFSPLLVLVLLFKRRFGVFLISLIPPAIGLVCTWFILGGNIKQLAFEPLQTSKIAMGPGFGDVMTPLEIGLRHAGFAPNLAYLIPTLVGLSSAVIFAFFIARAKNLDEKIQFAVIIALTLFCFKHVVYDFIVLLVPVAAALNAKKSTARTPYS